MTDEEYKYLVEITGEIINTKEYGKIDKRVFYQAYRVVFKIMTLNSILKAYNIPYKIDINITDVDKLTELEKQFFTDTLEVKLITSEGEAGEIVKKAHKNNLEEV